MKTKLTSIIIGLVLVLGVGTLVYKTKQPVLLPTEDITNGQSTINNNTSTQTQLPTNTNNTQKATTTKKSWFEDDDEDDDDYKSATSNGSTTSNTTTNTTPTTSTANGITLATISKHNGRSSCWSAVNGSVYDLTSWIPNHPGGEQVILSMCGLDGSNSYNGQHGGSGKPARILSGFKIGILAK